MHKKTISRARKFIAFIFLLIFFMYHIQAQEKKICNIDMDNIDTTRQDTIYGSDLLISTIDSNIL